jgi:hypothetical protein
VTPAALDRLDVNISPGRPAARAQVTVGNSHRSRRIRVTARVVGDPAFSVSPVGCVDRLLAPDQSCPLTVTFAPTALGAHRATLTVTDQDGRASSIPLAGTGHVVLTVAVQNPGAGRVTGGPVSCTSVCGVRITRVPLTLVAAPVRPGPSAGPTPGTGPIPFRRWENCPGPEGARCTVRPKADLTVTAVFRTSEID